MPAPANISCLIVDDSSIVRKVARRILEDLDYIVDEAEDGQEAFDKCRQEMPDLLRLRSDLRE